MTPARVGLVAAAALLTLLGWWTFWFLCDDAYIAFRYASNARAGHGYVWNRPPFHPVEGYTSFAWLVLLDLAWRLSGRAPPETANAFALAFSLASLLLVARLASTRPLAAALEPTRTAWLALILAATVSNRTWLTWASSGLETALWTLALLAWVDAGRGADDPRRAGWWVGVASALPLIRPDGLLFAAATPVMALATHRRPWLLAPLALPAIHLGWRWRTYGEWLPNTYAAKVTEPWPEMGARYLASFALEYGFVWWVPLAFMGLAATVRLDRALAVWGLLAAHTAWYLVAVGGDHFEYRVLVHWIPLLWLALPGWLGALSLSARRSVAVGGALLLLGLPIPWAHWWHSRPLVEGSRRARQFVAVQPHLPAWAGPVTGRFDRLQKELIEGYVCLRWHSHANYSREQRDVFGTREDGVRISGDGWPVFARNGVGYPAWVMPEVAILDKKGLNDRVVARTPLRRPKRLMAHEHVPPEGYVPCFAPNVRATGGTIRVVERDEPLTPEAIVACEERFFDALSEP